MEKGGGGSGGGVPRSWWWDDPLLKLRPLGMSPAFDVLRICKPVVRHTVLTV